MYQFIGEGNKVSFDMGVQSILNSNYLDMSFNDNTIIRMKQMVDKSKDSYINLLCDVLARVIVDSINKRTTLCVPCYLIKITGELDEKEELLAVTIDTPEEVSAELIKIILEEEFKDETDRSSTRGIPIIF